ncbi:unnamed protein product [Moneuplotes crassus]|uniref:Uncharacterized protein n=2 Tax=Euplotes crassus TaxID=5936 RepID=A0AAD2D7T7_EUPCR|nr:unnamed protein product [Moneuplotes crassus]
MDNILAGLDDIEADIKKSNNERHQIEKEQKKAEMDEFFDDALADIDLQVEKNVNLKEKTDLQGELTKLYMNLLTYNEQENQVPADENDYIIYDVDQMYENFEKEEGEQEERLFNAAHKYFSTKYSEVISKEDFDRFTQTTFA